MISILHVGMYPTEPTEFDILCDDGPLRETSRLKNGDRGPVADVFSSVFAKAMAGDPEWGGIKIEIDRLASLAARGDVRLYSRFPESRRLMLIQREIESREVGL